MGTDPVLPRVGPGVAGIGAWGRGCIGASIGTGRGAVQVGLLVGGLPNGIAGGQAMDLIFAPLRGWGPGGGGGAHDARRTTLVTDFGERRLGPVAPVRDQP